MARHVLRNALFAPMGVMVVYLPALLSGSLVMENLFSIPGMGRELMILWQQRDFEALLFLFSFQASIAVLVWSMLDILLAWADPRIRLEK
jgi:ABC-type dipeptide/oligopeptide/nickel transport system permease component